MNLDKHGGSEVLELNIMLPDAPPPPPPPRDVTHSALA